MPTFIALIRGINVGGHKKLSMADLRATCESLGFTNVRTLLNSGNVVFEAKKSDAKKLQDAIEPKVILRTPDELEEAIRRLPFDLKDRNPSRLIVVFLDSAPKGQLTYDGPEEKHLDGRHLYIYYGESMADSKLSNALIERQLGVPGTARNWNTVLKLMAMSHPKG